MEARQLFSNLHHYIKDYQGNVRCVVRHDGTLVESNEYYPYGGLFSATASTQPYKYGSKELDRTNGLDLYDSEARWYDSLLGRTTTMDPLAEKYYGLSPYAWCAGNPVKFVDPDGNTISIIIEEGIYQYDYDNSSFVDS
ncbi:MAG: RHS repeat-associated core domain-containing protein, partial [Muribaculaceae bacterium]|nr:RHS repeat-associated core domain-containing protein [Muribaculaceae bacterium]